MRDSEVVQHADSPAKPKSNRDHSIDPSTTNQTQPPPDLGTPPRPPYGGPEGEGDPQG